MDHITEDCGKLLADLTSNSKRVIDKFSKLAWDNKGDEIVEAMEKHLRQIHEYKKTYMFQNAVGGKVHHPDMNVEDPLQRLTLSDSSQTSAKPERGGEATASTTRSVLTQTAPSLKVYSPEFTEALSTYDDTGLADMETKLIESIGKSSSGKESNLECCLNYLLLDPGVISGMNSVGDKESFKVFVAAIFYVGKGQGTRPNRHFHEAIKHMKTQTQPDSDNVQRIIDIWSEKVGVVILNCFQNVLSEEALTREACMIDAIGLDQLTNEKSGSYYSISEIWSETQRKKMGIYFLKKAFQIFQAEGAKPILPADMKS